MHLISQKMLFLPNPDIVRLQIVRLTKNNNPQGKRCCYYIIKMEEKSNFRKGLERILASGVILVSGLIGNANATDTLIINNNLNSSIAELRVQHKVGASEGYVGGSEDATYANPSLGLPGIYSDIVTKKLVRDARPIDSNTPFDLKLVYHGSLASSTANNLVFAFGTESFGNKPILFQSDRMPYGLVVDVRRAIAQNGGIVQLKDLPAGNYSPDTPYGTGILTIGTRLLADLDDSGRVDNRDFSILAKDWQKPQGQYIGDIVGPNGIPEGYVDEYDLGAFSDSWLADVNDPNTW